MTINSLTYTLDTINGYIIEKLYETILLQITIEILLRIQKIYENTLLTTNSNL